MKRTTARILLATFGFTAVIACADQPVAPEEPRINRHGEEAELPRKRCHKRPDRQQSPAAPPRHPRWIA